MLGWYTSVKADLVIIAEKVVSYNYLFIECQQKRIASEIYSIGDAFNPGSVFEATKSGHAMGRLL